MDGQKDTQMLKVTDGWTEGHMDVTGTRIRLSILDQECTDDKICLIPLVAFKL